MRIALNGRRDQPSRNGDKLKLLLPFTSTAGQDPAKTRLMSPLVLDGHLRPFSGRDRWSPPLIESGWLDCNWKAIQGG